MADEVRTWSASDLVITHCRHGLDLRLHPRCYQCQPAPDLLAAARAVLVRYVAVDGSYGMFDAAALHEAREAAARIVTPKEILDEQDRVLDAIRGSAAIEEADR